MMQLDPKWEFIADTVMGGVSTGSVAKVDFERRGATVLRGEVSIDNGGGFVQMAFDLRENNATEDVSLWHGIEVAVWGKTVRPTTCAFAPRS